ncbi:related to amine oxidase [Cephalotrichum gorgonifer]|uniref:Amine oxidase n=1 Tax=Cephalotrichum gorgonifer TaxID=2041049 RepID=A0AAE8N692_9PEZI|nr:related to amine oxidase [Cephalotrichum gorgonifer]
MFDVVVIGAGFSGLQAAYSAQQTGLSVVVVEARDRVGGKSWTVPLANGRGVADLGAAWVNDNLQPRIWSYIKKFGLESKIVKQRLGHKAVLLNGNGKRMEFLQGTTPEFSPEEKRSLEKVRDHIQAESLKPGGLRKEDDEVSLDQYVRNLGAGPETVAMVNLWVRVMHGLESTEESAAWFIDYCRSNRGLLAIRADDHTGGNYMRITTGRADPVRLKNLAELKYSVLGTQSIARGIAGLIGHGKIHLSSPVVSIENNKSHVNVATTTGKVFRARKAIISIPSTMYKELNFSPALPTALREVTSAAKLGHYNKAIVFYQRPWWRDLGFNGFVMSYKGPACVIRDTSVDDAGVYGFTCFVNGREGEKWATLYPHERRKVILDELAAAFDVGQDSEAYHPIEFFGQIWQHEEYSRGALAPVTAIGHYTKFAGVYGKPVGNLHFVGTEYSDDWKGYMEGALASGEKGAKEVIDALGKEMPRSRL